LESKIRLPNFAAESGDDLGADTQTKQEPLSKEKVGGEGMEEAESFTIEDA